MFVINGGMYAFSAPIWGLLCDKKLPGKLVISIGACFIAFSFLFLGPVPFIPIPTTFGVCIVSLVIHAIGFAAQLVAGFSVAHREALAHGFPDNLDTYALVSGLWTSTFAFGAFVGPSAAGALVDYFQFSRASLFVFVSQISVLLLALVFVAADKRRKKRVEGYEEIQATTEDLQRSRTPSLGYETLSSGEASEEERLIASQPLSVKHPQNNIFSPIASPFEGLTAGTTGISLAVECQAKFRQPKRGQIDHSVTDFSAPQITVTAIVEESKPEHDDDEATH